MSSGVERISMHIEKFIGAISLKTAYVILLLFFAYQQSDVPRWAKNIILGSIAYFLNPFDSIPDLTPILGFTDDMGILMFGLSTIACYIDPTVKEIALLKLKAITKKDIDPKTLDEINAWL